MRADPRVALAQSWVANADAWTAAVRARQIESRRLVTDAAILAAVLDAAPRRVLDLGCGEGWLCRALAEAGIEAIGVDASAPLIAAAQQLGGGRYRVLPYDQLSELPDGGTPFDLIVCNFALLEPDTRATLNTLRSVAAHEARLLIQTVHPVSACGDAPYADGWRHETFSGFGTGFTAVMPWYFRTLSSWLDSLRESGWYLESLREPLHPQTGKPASLLMQAMRV